MGVRRARGWAQLIAYQAKVTLLHCGRPIWRRFLIYPATTLEQLHGMLQAVMGWEDCHEYLFQYTPLDARGRKLQWRAILSEDQSTTVVGDVLQHPGDALHYTYDLGDYWEHRVELERILPAPSDVACPVVLAGARACPPEDLGGPEGYRRYSRAFDAEAFDLGAHNRALTPPARRRTTTRPTAFLPPDLVRDKGR